MLKDLAKRRRLFLVKKLDQISTIYILVKAFLVFQGLNLLDFVGGLKNPYFNKQLWKYIKCNTITVVISVANKFAISPNKIGPVVNVHIFKLAGLHRCVLQELN